MRTLAPRQTGAGGAFEAPFKTNFRPWTPGKRALVLVLGFVLVAANLALATETYRFESLPPLTDELWVNNKSIFKEPKGVNVEFVTAGAFDWVFADASGKEVRTRRDKNEHGGWTGVDLPSLGLYGDYSIGFRNVSPREQRIKEVDVTAEGLNDTSATGTWVGKRVTSATCRVGAKSLSSVKETDVELVLQQLGAKLTGTAAYRNSRLVSGSGNLPADKVTSVSGEIHGQSVTIGTFKGNIQGNVLALNNSESNANCSGQSVINLRRR